MKNMKHISAIPYVSLVLIEPTIVTPDLFYAHAAHMIPVVVAATMMRRETWPSRDNAFEWLRRRSPWKAWDERVLRMLTVGRPFSRLAPHAPLTRLSPGTRVSGHAGREGDAEVRPPPGGDLVSGRAPAFRSAG
jgi:hypothetical protein